MYVMAGWSCPASAAAYGGNDSSWTGFPSSSFSSATGYCAATPPTPYGDRNVLRPAGVVRHPYRRVGRRSDRRSCSDGSTGRGSHFWDYLVWACYMTHFFASFIIAGVLWKTNYPKFRR